MASNIHCCTLLCTGTLWHASSASSAQSLSTPSSLVPSGSGWFRETISVSVAVVLALVSVSASLAQSLSTPLSSVLLGSGLYRETSLDKLDYRLGKKKQIKYMKNLLLN